MKIYNNVEMFTFMSQTINIDHNTQYHVELQQTDFFVCHF